MKLVRNLAVALSMYSKIPMPVFEWKEGDMKHNLVFLPLVGLIIGGLIVLLSFGFQIGEERWELCFPPLFHIAAYSLAPLLLTGGFHLDGFMDLMDARKSYQPKEVKLEILKDPHIGAFAVIQLATYGLIWLGAMSLLVDPEDHLLWCMGLGFYLVRAICGEVSLCLPKAKKSGMLSRETREETQGDKLALLVEILLGFVALGFLDWRVLLVEAVFLLAFVLYYKQLCSKQFGGLTGDTAGYFITMGEEVFLLGLTLIRILG